MYIKAKEMGKKYKKSNSINNNIQDSQGNILKDKEKIKGRWKEYFENLYDAANKPTTCYKKKKPKQRRMTRDPSSYFQKPNLQNTS